MIDTAATAPAPIYAETIPVELRIVPQWGGWRRAVRAGKATKVPVNPKSGCNMSVTDRQARGTFDEAMVAVSRFHLAGVNFVLTADDPYVGMDLDGCHDPETGALDPWAADIVRQLDSYTEVSPSGRGVKISSYVGRFPRDGADVARWRCTATHVPSQSQANICPALPQPLRSARRNWRPSIVTPSAMWACTHLAPSLAGHDRVAV